MSYSSENESDDDSRAALASTPNVPANVRALVSPAEDVRVEIAELKRKLSIKSQMLKDQKTKIDAYFSKLKEAEAQLLSSQEQLKHAELANQKLTQELEASKLSLKPMQSKKSSEDSPGAQRSQEFEDEVEKRLSMRLAAERARIDNEAKASPSSSQAPLSDAEKALLRYQEAAGSNGASQSSKDSVNRLLAEAQNGRISVEQNRTIKRLVEEIKALREFYAQTRHEVYILRAQVSKFKEMEDSIVKVTGKHQREVELLRIKMNHVVEYFKRV